jgi:hypothetical protein
MRAARKKLIELPGLETFMFIKYYDTFLLLFKVRGKNVFIVT